MIRLVWRRSRAVVILVLRIFWPDSQAELVLNPFDIVSRFRRASLCLLHTVRGVLFKGVA